MNCCTVSTIKFHGLVRHAFIHMPSAMFRSNVPNPPTTTTIKPVPPPPLPPIMRTPQIRLTNQKSDTSAPSTASRMRKDGAKDPLYHPWKSVWPRNNFCGDCGLTVGLGFNWLECLLCNQVAHRSCQVVDFEVSYRDGYSTNIGPTACVCL